MGNQPVNEKSKFFFIALLPFTLNGDAAVKFEANPMLRLQVRCTSFSLASSCSNDYYITNAIIDFLANRLISSHIYMYTSRSKMVKLLFFSVFFLEVVSGLWQEGALTLVSL